MTEQSAPREDCVLYEVADRVATITMNRPECGNAQNAEMTYLLDGAFKRAAANDDVSVIILKGAGKHFSSGHDIGSPGRDIHLSQERVSLWYDHANKPGAEFLYVREAEAYLGMCRRWRDLPKPTIAEVHGACIAGGLMLAWVCDLIVASEDAFFSDPVLRMGIPGVEYFAHAYELNARAAKEFLFLGERMSARRACELGMVNRVVARDELHTEVRRIAEKIATIPRLGLALAKQAINHAEDLQGKRAAMDAAFAWHHLAHAHNKLLTGDNLAGENARSMSSGESPHPGDPVLRND